MKTTTETVKILISQIAGVNVDLIVRAKNEYTVSFEGKNENAEKRLVKYFKAAAKVESVYYSDINSTCIFIN